MAERHEDIDALFRNQLAGHSEKPSPQAWRKLEGKLHNEKKGLIIPWMKIAASFFLALGLVSLLWWSLRNTERELTTVAQEEAIPQTFQEPAVNKGPVQNAIDHPGVGAEISLLDKTDWKHMMVIDVFFND